MATASVAPTISKSFDYEKLASHVKAIQNQMTEMTNNLATRCKYDKTMQDQLKSRLFLFADPSGNQIYEKFMDHQLLSQVIKYFAKNYLSQYLQKRMHIGTIVEDQIVPLKRADLKSTVSKYPNGFQFVTYSEINVWIGTSDETWSCGLAIKILPNDNIEKIKMRLKNRVQCTRIELRLCTGNYNQYSGKLAWDDAKILQSEDCIFPFQLNDNPYRLMAKIVEETVSDQIFFFN